MALLEREALLLDRVEGEIGRHQLGERGRVGRRVGVTLGQRLAAR
jgi:hypothetical protein